MLREFTGRNDYENMLSKNKITFMVPINLIDLEFSRGLYSYYKDKVGGIISTMDDKKFLKAHSPYNLDDIIMCQFDGIEPAYMTEPRFSIQIYKIEIKEISNMTSRDYMNEGYRDKNYNTENDTFSDYKSEVKKLFLQDFDSDDEFVFVYTFKILKE